jgi:hypothetical protein
MNILTEKAKRVCCNVGHVDPSAAWCVLCSHVQESSNAQQQQQQQSPPAAEPCVPPPQLLARFRVNQQDTLAVFKAVSVEDFGDVAGLLPPNTALPAADKMTYLIARLEVRGGSRESLLRPAVHRAWAKRRVALMSSPCLQAL